MTDQDPANPSRLLMEACDVVDMIADGVGLPDDCLRRGFLPRREGRKIGRLLTALEALMRRILVILAFALMPANAERQPLAKRAAQPAGRPNAPSPRASDPEADPQAALERELAALATISFRLLTPHDHPWHGGAPMRFIGEGEAIGRTSSASREPPQPLISTTRLARRYAAALRVIANPEPVAKRLAAKLRRLARPDDHVELSRNAAHLDIDTTVWRRGAPKSKERLWIERHPCRRAHIAAAAQCVALAEDWWDVCLPSLSGG